VMQVNVGVRSRSPQPTALPGISIPVAQVDGLPVGLQIVGNYFEEERLLNMAHRLQQATDWHLVAPATERFG
jgi:Asp-tRNA(Asn)/Glu-tRNA(Gln) amidotransferase A subunit family amidase